MLTVAELISVVVIKTVKPVGIMYTTTSVIVLAIQVHQVVLERILRLFLKVLPLLINKTVRHHILSRVT